MFSTNPASAFGLIPLEVQAHINGYVPYEKCKMCHKQVIEFGKETGDYFCSISCLNAYNKIMLNRLKYNKSVIISHRFAVCSNYVYAISYISCMAIVTFIIPLSFIILALGGLIKLVVLIWIG